MSKGNPYNSGYEAFNPSSTGSTVNSQSWTDGESNKQEELDNASPESPVKTVTHFNYMEQADVKTCEELQKYAADFDFQKGFEKRIVEPGSKASISKYGSKTRVLMTCKEYKEQLKILEVLHGSGITPDIKDHYCCEASQIGCLVFDSADGCLGDCIKYTEGRCIKDTLKKMSVEDRDRLCDKVEHLVKTAWKHRVDLGNHVISSGIGFVGQLETKKYELVLLSLHGAKIVPNESPSLRFIKNMFAGTTLTSKEDRQKNKMLEENKRLQKEVDQLSARLEKLE